MMLEFEDDLDSYIRQENRRLTIKLIHCWLAFVCLFPLATSQWPLLEVVSTNVGWMIPSLRGRILENSSMSRLVVSYFLLAAMLIPFAVAYLVFSQDIVKRAEFGMPDFSAMKRIFVSVGFIAPVALLFLLLFYFGFDFGPSDRLIGQKALRQMIDTPFGLFAFGSLFVTIVCIFAGIFLGAIWLPVASTFQRLREI